MKRTDWIVCAGVAGGLVLLAVAGLVGGWLACFVPWGLVGLLALPLLFLLSARSCSGLPSRTHAIALAIRSAAMLLIVLCLSDVQTVRRSEGTCVLYLMDHSASIPADIAVRQLAYVNASAATRGREDLAGIVVLGEDASVEVLPTRQLKVDRLYSAVGKTRTDLQNAVELATAVFPPGMHRRLVLITDGNENKGSLLDGVRMAAGNRVTVDVLPVQYRYTNEVMVESLHLPESIREQEAFLLKVNIVAQQDTPAELALFRNNALVQRETLNLKAGENTRAISVRIDQAGFHAFNARVTAPSDGLQENNEAFGCVYIQGTSRLLFVAPTDREVRPLVDACREDQLETDVVTPEEFPGSLGELQNHDCIILANVPSEAFSKEQMEMIRADVRDLGVGLVMIGGENSFGAGGYQDTPIEEALPVTMDIRQKKINPKGALVMVLHTCEFADGNYWAKQIAKKAIETVGRQDDVGVLVYGSGEEWLFPLQPATDKESLYKRIDQANPGDMPSFEPTLRMAHKALLASDAMVKHVIIVSDGDPARPAPELIKQMASAGITISTVAINPHSPRDVDVMKYLAYETGGRYYFADDPTVLPRIFTKEAKVVKRSLIFNKEFQPILVVSSELTQGITREEVPSLLAYVATTARPTAFVPMVSDNENQDPILAGWRYGLGKAVAFTSDATVNWGRNWVPWSKYRRLWTQTIRWASRRRDKSCLRLHTEIAGTRGRLIADAVDEQGRFVNFLKLQGRLVTPHNEGKVLDIRQTAPGRYEAEFEAADVGVSLLSVGYSNPQNGSQGFSALGVAVPYAPEFHRLQSNLPLLREVAAAGGGRLLSGDPLKDRVFAATGIADRIYRPAWEYLLPLALLLFLADIVMRRVIVSRQDVRDAWGAVRARLVLRRRGVVRDETMAALLKRKQKTREPTGGATGAAPAFKARLEQAAARAPRDARPPVEELAKPTQEASKTGAKGEAGLAGGTVPEPKEAGDAYTSRLLAAKRRVRKQTESGTDTEDGKKP